MNTVRTTLRPLKCLLAGAALLVCAPAAWAQVNAYEQDFEMLDQAGLSSLGDDGWLGFANVFAPDGVTYLYGYGTFPAPNGGPAFSGIALEEGGPDQGLQVLAVYNDYNNADHNIGNRIEASVFQEQTITAENVGQTWVFTFDAKKGNIEAASTATAFIKTIDPNAGFALTNSFTVDTTALSPDWDTFTISITIDASLPGQLLQFGFANVASNFEGSGNFYDNISLAQDESGLLAPYSQNFETLDPEGELIGDGWLFFVNVFDSGDYLFGYGGDAPNGPQISAIAVGQGGPDQGEQQLSVYSDYNCCQPDVGHLSPTGSVETNVFQQRNITGADVGDTWTFSFDAKKGNIELSSNAVAFIKTLDPASGFFTTNFLTVDTTALPESWGRYEISITIDASLPGQILQFGFATTASNFEGSGNVYDNVDFNSGADSDGDGVNDDTDNCTLIANADQRDTDGDDIGNVCDQDLSGNCSVSFEDLGLLKAAFFTAGPDADFDGNGVVSFEDLGAMKAAFFGPPGPSAAGCN